MSDGRKILYVEDDPDIRMIAELTLESLGGYQVSACESGAQALALIADGLRPDLLLFDVMMPGMDGTDLLEHCRTQMGDALPPVIFATAKARREEIDRLMALGALDVVVKPFDPSVLVERVGEALNG